MRLVLAGPGRRGPEGLRSPCSSALARRTDLVPRGVRCCDPGAHLRAVSPGSSTCDSSVRHSLGPSLGPTVLCAPGGCAAEFPERGRAGRGGRSCGPSPRRHVEPAADGATLNPGGEGMCCRAQVRSHIWEIASRHEKVERALLGVCGKSPLPQPGEDPPPENTKGRHVPERSRRQRE